MTNSPVPGVTLKTTTANTIHMRYAEAGSGPLVLLCHGWPESWYSWRHQLQAVSAAGFRAVAPDPRGYGATEFQPVDAASGCGDSGDDGPGRAAARVPVARA